MLQICILKQNYLVTGIQFNAKTNCFQIQLCNSMPFIFSVLSKSLFNFNIFVLNICCSFSSEVRFYDKKVFIICTYLSFTIQSKDILYLNKAKHYLSFIFISL